jgi:hypothetical protein
LDLRVVLLYVLLQKVFGTDVKLDLGVMLLDMVR